MARVLNLTDRQIEVLRWIGDGCPPCYWPDETHKNTALASRGLAHVGRKKKVWTAKITWCRESVWHAENQLQMVPPELLKALADLVKASK